MARTTNAKSAAEFKLAATVLAAVFLAVGCGGGAGSTGGSAIVADVSPVNVVRTNADEVAQLVTMPEYRALRNTVVTVLGGVAPSASEMAALTTDSYQTAAQQLAPLLGAGNNALVVPPLTVAITRTLAAAASGDTLTQITTKFDVAPTPYIASMQTRRVASQFWADRPHRFRTGFLAATDSLGAFPRLASWAGAETGLSSGAYVSDAAFIASLRAFEADFGLYSLGGETNQVKLFAAHRVAESAAWAQATPFEGVFDRGLTGIDLLTMPMVRVAQGVKRFEGVDFTADVLPMAAGQQLFSLRPHAGMLAGFNSGRLPAALAEASRGLLLAGAAPVPGELVLPLLQVGLDFSAKAPLIRAGVTLPFDEVNANLRNLDGLGGTYAVNTWDYAHVNVTVDGLAIKAIDATSFRFSKKNVFGSGGIFGGITATNNPGDVVSIDGIKSFNLFQCVWPTPNLRPFFLVVLDGEHQVVALAAIQGPPGTPTLPTRVAFNPWPEDERWAFHNNMTASFSTTPFAGEFVDVLSQTAQFGFFYNEALRAYSHQSCATQ